MINKQVATIEPNVKHLVDAILCSMLKRRRIHVSVFLFCSGVLSHNRLSGNHCENDLQFGIFPTGAASRLDLFLHSVQSTFSKWGDRAYIEEPRPKMQADYSVALGNLQSCLFSAVLLLALFLVLWEQFRRMAHSESNLFEHLVRLRAAMFDILALGSLAFLFYEFSVAVLRAINFWNFSFFREKIRKCFSLQVSREWTRIWRGEKNYRLSCGLSKTNDVKGIEKLPKTSWLPTIRKI